MMAIVHQGQVHLALSSCPSSEINAGKHALNTPLCAWDLAMACAQPASSRRRDALPVSATVRNANSSSQHVDAALPLLLSSPQGQQWLAAVPLPPKPYAPAAAPWYPWEMELHQDMRRGLADEDGQPQPAIPQNCSVFTNPSADDDDSVSETLAWSNGSVHCSGAGLTQIPLLPSNSQYL